MDHMKGRRSQKLTHIRACGVHVLRMERCMYIGPRVRHCGIQRQTWRRRPLCLELKMGSCCYSHLDEAGEPGALPGDLGGGVGSRSGSRDRADGSDGQAQGARAWPRGPPVRIPGRRGAGRVKDYSCSGKSHTALTLLYLVIMSHTVCHTAGLGDYQRRVSGHAPPPTPETAASLNTLPCWPCPWHGPWYATTHTGTWTARAETSATMGHERERSRPSRERKSPRP